MQLTLESPLAQALSGLVQGRLEEEGWTTGGTDDSALGEYIMLMLVNGKTRDQLASELSTDLLSLPADDPAPHRFAQWLFDQAEQLHRQQAGPSQAAMPSVSNGEAPIESQNSMQTDDDIGTSIKGAAANRQTRESADADMQDAADNIPRGPRAMRDELRPGNKRMMNQMTRAMDRTGNSELRRVRTPNGTERISSHGRGGPRRQGRPQPDPARSSAIKMPGNGSQMTPQQQMQLLHLLEDQARMMAQILPAQQQQQFMQGLGSGQTRAGKSLFDRVENGNRRPSDHEMDEKEPSPDTMCKFNLKCTKKECIYAHQSPAAPAGTIVDVSDVCSFGAACKNRKCVGRHPSPYQRVAHASEQDCKYFPNCTNVLCPFRHPDTPPCRFGADCTRPDCKFVHVTIECKFNPCLNPGCVYKHAEGQKRGKFGDKVWTADGPQEHVSERKFVDPADQGEELVLPEASMEEQANEGSPRSAVLVT